MTKLLTIGLLLLSCGVAEAQQDIYIDCLHEDPYGTTYDICRMPELNKILRDTADDVVMPKPFTSPDISAKITYCSNGRCETTCEEKMREAMKIADQYMPRHYHGMTGNTLEYCDAVCQAERALGQAKKEQRDLREWVQVMKECVK